MSLLLCMSRSSFCFSDGFLPPDNSENETTLSFNILPSTLALFLGLFDGKAQYQRFLPTVHFMRKTQFNISCIANVNTYLKHIFEFFSTLHSWLTRLSHRTTLNRQQSTRINSLIPSPPPWLLSHSQSPTSATVSFPVPHLGYCLIPSHPPRLLSHSQSSTC